MTAVDDVPADHGDDDRSGSDGGLASGDRTAVLWVYGPAGVGKTTVAWELHRQLVRRGLEVGYVDIDQLGMCYPEPPSDPGRFHLAARNLAAVVAGHRSAGARAVVVSGVVDPARGPADPWPGVALTSCRLRADPGVLTSRLVARQGDEAMVAEALAEAGILDAAERGDPCVDTSALPVDEVVRLVQEGTAGWVEQSGSQPEHVEPAGSPPVRAASAGTAWAVSPVEGRVDGGSIVWLCGPTGVGKSAAGFAFYLGHVLGRQIPGAFVDLDQIGFYRPAASGSGIDHRMRARILADLWRAFRESGARCLTVVGPAEDRAAVEVYREALPAGALTVCRLHAGRSELTRRIALRGQGQNWAQPGDPLKGLSAEDLSAVADRAGADAERLERAAVGDARIETDERTVQDVADAIAAVTGWPAGSAG